jgi:class 3 adenylate cyclase/tetratricopeptide (TPR) repeat protein
MAGAAVACPSCGSENAPDQRFCGTCGGSLLRTCPACGTENPLRFAFCGTCGAALEASVTPATPGAEERRIATVLFADVSGFTSLSERMDPEDVKTLAHDLTEQMGDVVAGYGGTVISVMGDAVMAVFGAPIAHEDDPERAVRAALAMRDSLRTPDGIGARLQLHIGINTGEVMAGMMGPEARRDYTVMGDVTNTAARLQSAAGPGEILVGETTRAATGRTIEYEEGAPVQAKGKEAPVPAWRAVVVVDEMPRRPVSRAPLVGRSAELGVLAALWDRVRTDRRVHLLTVLGQPGIGKSRLLREFEATAEGTGTMLRGRCLPYGETTGYGAFGQQVKLAAGILESDQAPTVRARLGEGVAGLLGPEGSDEAGDVADHLAILLGLSSHGSPDKHPMFLSARRFVEALGRERPTVLLFEDVHWAEPPLLELIQFLAARAREAPVLLVTTARPELLDVSPSWGGGIPRLHSMTLEPLPEDDARALALALLPAGGTEVPIEDLLRTGGGNPLFIEELAASVSSQAAEAPASLPTSIQGIIAARLDALPGTERAVLQDASVIGRFFWPGALEAIRRDGAAVGEALDALELKDFIRRQPTSRLTGEPEFLFKHVLIREVAYATIPRAQRPARHEAVARYLEQAAGDRARESASLLAHHWKAADQPAKAARYLVAAADLASRAWAKQEAIALYSEAVELLEAGGDRELLEDARLGRTRSRIDTGDYTKAIVEDIDRLLPTVGGRKRALALMARSRAAYWLGSAEDAHVFAEQTADVAREAGDVELEARALAMLGEVAAMDGDLDASLDLQGRAAAMWPEDRRDAEYAYAWTQIAVSNYWRGEFETCVRQAREGYERGLEYSAVYPAVNGAAHVGLGLTGLSRHEEAIEWFGRAVRFGREWELVPRLFGRALNMWAGALREIGDLAGARELNEEALDLGLRSAFPGAQVSARIDLMLVDLLEGEVGRAERLIPEIQEAAEKTKGWHQWLWTGRLADARAQIALLSGRLEEAVTRSEESLAHALRPYRRKYACRSRTLIGRALTSLGRPADAEPVLREAVSDAERLGHAPSLWPALASLADALEAGGAGAEVEQVRARARQSAVGFADSLSEEHRKHVRDIPDVAQLLSGSS